MSNPTSPSPSAFPQVASKKWSCSELQAGNQRLMESKVEDSSGDVKAVASYADQLRSRVEAGTLIWFPFVVGIPFESMICFSKKKGFQPHRPIYGKVLQRQLASAKLATPPTTPSPRPTSKALSDSVNFNCSLHMLVHRLIVTLFMVELVNEIACNIFKNG